MTTKNISAALMLLFVVTAGCTKPQTPHFKELEKIKITKANKDSLLLEATVIYNNPNAFGGKVTTTDIDVYVNDIAIGRINHAGETEIPKSSDFAVPISISFNPKVVLSENKGFLGQALKSFFKNELPIRFEGTATMEILNIPFKVPINQIDTVSLGLIN
jgi:LEA14-like dessication related protein